MNRVSRLFGTALGIIVIYYRAFIRGRIVLYTVSTQPVLLNFSDDKYAPYIKGLFGSWHSEGIHVAFGNWRLLMAADQLKPKGSLSLYPVVFPRKNKYEACITDKPHISQRDHWKVLSHDYFGKYKKTGYTPLPFVMHHTMYKNIPSIVTSTKRKTRVFFSGNSNRRSYDNPIFNETFGILNRYEILETLRENHDKFRNTVSFEGNAHAPIQILDWQWTPTENTNLNIRVDNRHWLEKLAEVDFFLCCPGVNMPFCHHAIEAMAMGCIPILQYHELFAPQLTNGVNCLVFFDGEDLIHKLKCVLTMSDEDIAQMRTNVINYYNAHLHPLKIRNILLNEHNRSFLFPVNVHSTQAFQARGDESVQY